MSGMHIPSFSSLAIITVCMFAPPLIGGLITGIIRYIKAKKQGRQNPPLLQDFYDFRSMWRSSDVSLPGTDVLCVSLSMVFHLLALIMLGLQMNFAPILFFQAFGVLALIMGSLSNPIPRCELSAITALKMFLTFQPVIFLVAAGIYFATGSFSLSAVEGYPRLLVMDLPLIFMALLYAGQTLRNRAGAITDKGPLAAVIQLSDCYRSGTLFLLAGYFLSNIPSVAVVASIILGILSAWFANAPSVLSGAWNRKWGWGYMYFACVLNITWIYIKFWM